MHRPPQPPRCLTPPHLLHRASKYRRRYLTDIDFDNFYITAQFKDLDRQVTSGGGASVLPLLSTEAKTYISPRQYTSVCLCVHVSVHVRVLLPVMTTGEGVESVTEVICVCPVSLQMSLTECRVALMGVVAVLRQAAISGVLVALDFLVFWTLDQVHHQMTVDIVARGERCTTSSECSCWSDHGNRLSRQRRARWQCRSTGRGTPPTSTATLWRRSTSFSKETSRW